MTEDQRQAADRPGGALLRPPHALDVGPEDSMEASLQQVINEGSPQSWELICVAQDPKGEGYLLIWDTSGFFFG
jgi:hypothetical protein